MKNDDMDEAQALSRDKSAVYRAPARQSAPLEDERSETEAAIRENRHPGKNLVAGVVETTSGWANGKVSR